MCVPSTEIHVSATGVRPSNDSPVYRIVCSTSLGAERWRPCVRGAVQKAAERLVRRKPAGDENPVRQLLIAVLRQRLLDWSRCTGLVHQMLRSYIWHKAPVDEARSRLPDLVPPKQRSVADTLVGQEDVRSGESNGGPHTVRLDAASAAHGHATARRRWCLLQDVDVPSMRPASSIGRRNSGCF